MGRMTADEIYDEWKRNKGATEADLIYNEWQAQNAYDRLRKSDISDIYSAVGNAARNGTDISDDNLNSYKSRLDAYRQDLNTVNNYYGISKSNSDIDDLYNIVSGFREYYNSIPAFQQRLNRTAFKKYSDVEALKKLQNSVGIGVKPYNDPDYSAQDALKELKYDPDREYYRLQDLIDASKNSEYSDEQRKFASLRYKDRDFIESMSEDELKLLAQMHNQNQKEVTHIKDNMGDTSKYVRIGEDPRRNPSSISTVNGTGKYYSPAEKMENTRNAEKALEDVENTQRLYDYDRNGNIVDWNGLYAERKLGNKFDELQGKVRNDAGAGELSKAYKTIDKYEAMNKAYHIIYYSGTANSESHETAYQYFKDLAYIDGKELSREEFDKRIAEAQENANSDESAREFLKTLYQIDSYGTGVENVGTIDAAIKNEFEKDDNLKMSYRYEELSPQQKATLLKRAIDGMEDEYARSKDVLKQGGYDWDELSKYRDYVKARDTGRMLWEADERAATKKHGWLEDYKNAIVGTLPRGFEGLKDMINAPSDSTELGSSAWLPSQVDNEYTLRNQISDEEVTKNMSDTGKWFYEAIKSFAQSTANMAGAVVLSPIPGLGQFAEGVSLFTMGLDSGAQTLYEAKERGLDNASAAKLGFASAMAEILTEKISLESASGLFKNALAGGGTKKLLANIGLQGLFEGSEEGASDLLMLVADDYINGGESEINNNIEKLVANGLSREEAEKQAVEDWFCTFFEDMAAGALSGALGGTMYTAAGRGFSGAYGFDKQHREIRKENKITGSTIIENGGVEALRNAAADMNIDTKSLDGKKVKTQDVGAVAQQVAKAAYVSGMTYADEELQNRVVRELEKRGVKNAAEVYDTYLEYERQGMGTETEVNPLSGDEKSGITVGKITEIKNEIQNSEDFKSSVAEGEKRYSRVLGDVIESAVKPTDFVNLEDVEVNSGGRNLNAETGSELGNVTVSGFHEKGNVILSTEDGEKISTKKVSFGSDNEAVLYKGVGLLHRDIGITEGIANDIISEYGNADLPAQKYVLGVREALRAGYTHQKLDNSGFAEYFKSPEQRCILERYYQVGENLAKKAVNSRVEKIRRNIEAKKKEGKTSRKQGNITLDKSVNWRKLSAKQKSQMKFVAPFLTKGIGVNVKFFESEVKNGKHVGINGKYVYYDGGTDTIWIDVFVGDNGQGAILYTLGHELTHFMIEHNPQGAQEFFDFLFEKYSDKGFRSKELLIEDQIEKSKQNEKPLSYDEAYEEVMADLCSAMLTDTDAAEKIIEYSKDKAGWKQALIDRLKAILARLKKFFKYSNPDSYEGAAGKQLFNECKDLCERLESTLVQAVENYQNESSSRQVNEDTTSIKFSKKIEEYPYSMQSVIEEYIKSKDNGLIDFIELFHKNKKFNRKTISNITSNLVTDIKSLLEIDVSDFIVCINTNAVEHIEIRHGKNGKSDNSMSNINDISRVGYILKNYDSIEIAKKGEDYVSSKEFRDKNDNPAPMIKIKKKINGTYYVALAIPDSKYKKLWVVSAYIRKKETVTQALNNLKNSNNGKFLASPVSTYSISETGAESQEENGKKSERSKSELDKRYLELAKEPEKNRAELQRIVRDYAVGAGYNITDVYHGTPSKDFTVFDKDRVGKGIDQYPNELHEALRDIVGIDGVEVAFKNGEKTYVSWFDTQMKSLDLVTYDDDGNIIPLSERFNEAKNDIRYSTRNNNKYQSFDKQLDSWDKKTVGFSFVLGTPSKALLSANIPDKQIRLDASKVKDLLGKHNGMSIEVVKGVARLLEEPVVIIDSKKNDNARIIMGDLYDENGKIVTTILLLTPTSKKGNQLDIIKISSIQGRGHIESLFRYEDGKNVRIRYFDKKRIQEWLNVNRLQLPLRSFTLDSNTIISDKEEKSQDNFEKFSTRSFESKTPAGNRSLLANALESTVSDEASLKYLSDYKAKLADLNKMQAELDEVNAEIKEISFSKGKRDRARLSELRDRSIILSNRIGIYDKKLLRLESTKPLMKVLEAEKKAQRQKDAEKLKAYREKANQRLEDTRKEYQEKRKKAIDKRKATALRNAIKDIRKDLADRIKHRGKNDRYIPQNLIGAVVDICDLIDPTGKDPNTKAAQKTKDGDAALRALRDAYEKIKSDNDIDYADEYDEYINDSLLDLAEAVGQTPLRDMTLEQLEKIYSIVYAIRGMVRDASKQVGVENAITHYQAGKNIFENMVTVSENGLKTPNFLWIRTGLTNPVRAAREMAGYDDNSQLIKLFEGLVAGQRKQAMWAMKANKMFEDLITEKRGRKRVESRWFKDSCEKVLDDWGFYDPDGNVLKMTKQQAMQIVLTWEREMSNRGMIHLQTGGVKLPDAKEAAKGKAQKAIDNAQTTGPVDSLFIDRIKAKFDKNDLKFMEIARQFFNETAKDAVNETSLLVKHRLIALNQAYIPIEVDEDYVKRESEGVKFDASIENMSMTKETVTGAQQPVVIRGLYDSIQNHISDVSKYYGLAVPIKNINKALNVTLTAEDGGRSVKSAITGTWGQAGLKQLQQAIDDLQTSRKNDSLKIANKLREAFVVSTLSGNISVTIKQLASLPAAGAYISAGSLKKGTARYVKDFLDPSSKAEDRYAKIDQYTARHYERRKGLSTAELGDFAQSKSMIKKVTDKAGKLSPFNWIQAADVAATAALWYASEEEIKKQGMKETDPGFNEAVADLYNKVIEETQPMYDSMHRVEASKHGFTSKFFIFQTQPMQNAGILREGILEYRAMKKLHGANSQQAKRAAVKMRKAITSQIATSIVFVAMTQLARAVLHKVNPWRDDEKGEVELDNFIHTMGYETAENLFNVVLPWFGGLALSAAEALTKRGNSEIIQEPTVNFFNDLFQTGSKMLNPTLENLESVVFKAGSLFGLPLNNVKNIFSGIKNSVMDFANGNFGEWEASAHYTNSQDAVRLYNALLEGDKDKTEKIISGFDTKSSVRTSLNGYIKPLYLEAEENKDNEKITEIKKVMDASGLYVDEGESTVNKTLDGFIKNEKKTKWKNDYVEAYRAKDYATLNKIRQEMISSGYYAGSGKVDKSYDNVAETIKKWTDDLIE